jgi:ubiquinone biosynthesis protein COQ4
MEHVAETSIDAPPARKREWRRAWHALRNLIEDPERTDQVFEIVRALSGDSFERAYQRFTATPEGRQLLAERPSLLAVLSDREGLRALPEHSFGRVYADFMQAGQLDAAGLVEAEQMAEQNFAKEGPLDPDREFFGDRLRDMHDLWHVLTDYGRDEAGEAANLAFTLGQVWNPGIAFIVAAGAVIGPKDPTFHWQRYLYSAWRRGRATHLLTTAPYERLLGLPLDEVRRQLGVPPAREAHPDGILVGNRGEEPHVVDSGPGSGWSMSRKDAA